MNKEKTFLNSKFIMFIMLSTFFKPICFQFFSKYIWIEKIFIIGKILVAGVILVRTFSFLKLKKKRQDIIYKIIIFELWIVVITVFKGNNMLRAVTDFITISALFLMIELFAKIDFKKFINVFEKLLLILIIFQILTEILFPNGLKADLYTNTENPLFFVTTDNGTFGLLCLFIFIFNFNRKTYADNKKIKYIIYNFLSLSTAILSRSSTALICTVTLIIGIFCSRIKNFKIIERKSLWIILFLIVVYFIFAGPNSLIIKFISNITNKRNFTGRDFLWNEAIQLIIESPLIGYGRRIEDYLKVWGGTYSSHNIFLETMLQGGIIALILLIRIILNTLKDISRLNNKQVKKISFVTLFILLISMMMEANVHSVYLFSIMAMVNYIKKNERNLINEKEIDQYSNSSI